MWHEKPPRRCERCASDAEQSGDNAAKSAHNVPRLSVKLRLASDRDCHRGQTILFSVDQPEARYGDAPDPSREVD